jgi:leucyl aminopeptidase
MQISVAVALPKKQANSCVIMGVFSKGQLSASVKQLGADCETLIKQAIKLGDCSGKIDQTRLLYTPDSCPWSRVLLVGLGDKKSISPAQYSKSITSTIEALRDTGVAVLNIMLPLDTDVIDRTKAWQCQLWANMLTSAEYDYRAPAHSSSLASIKKTVLFIAKNDQALCRIATKQGSAIGAGICQARELGDLPANICTPSFLENRAKSLAKNNAKLKLTVIGEKQMAKLGMGAFLSVSQGSAEEAKLIAMEYKGGKPKQAPVVLLGKGVTFDTGGISIKPSAGMDEMKYDMCGAASVFGAMHACISLGLPVNVIGVVAAAENMPGGKATRPGDVVTSMSGQTIEVLNTDAEGRMVLCDSLTYIERYKPAAVVDMATLTGACIVALGHVSSALLGNDQELAAQLVDAGEMSGDKCWQLPLWDEYQRQLDSNFADMANIGGSPAGTITAACFLSRFAKKYPWAHLDIAGIAWNSGKQKGATGKPVAQLMQYLIDNHV